MLIALHLEKKTQYLVEFTNMLLLISRTPKQAQLLHYTNHLKVAQLNDSKQLTMTLARQSLVLHTTKV